MPRPPGIAYPTFVPDHEAHTRLVRTLQRVRRTLEARHEWTDHPDLLIALRDLHPRRIYEAARFFCTHRATWIAAVEEDAPEMVRLRIDGLGMREGLDAYVPWMGLRGAVRMLSALDERGGDLSVAEPGGHRMTAAHWAVEHESLDTLRFLVARVGNAKEKRNARGLTPLGYAVSVGRMDAAQVLLGAGAVVDASLLVRALVQRVAIEALIDAAPSLDAADPSTGLTPLHAAVLLGDEDAAEHLLRRGADPSVRTRGAVRFAGVEVARGRTAEDLRRTAAPAPARRSAPAGVEYAPTVWV